MRGRRRRLRGRPTRTVRGREKQARRGDRRDEEAGTVHPGPVHRRSGWQFAVARYDVEPLTGVEPARFISGAVTINSKQFGFLPRKAVAIVVSSLLLPSACDSNEA